MSKVKKIKLSLKMDWGATRKLHRVLYLDCAYYKGTHEWYAGEIISYSLKKQYNIDRRYALDQTIISVVETAQSSDPYSIMITHVPYHDSWWGNPRTLPESIHDYTESFDILKKIKQISDIPFIAYTNEGILGTVFFHAYGIDAIVRRSEDPSLDIKSLEYEMERLLREYRKGLPSVPPPLIKQNGGQTSTEIIVMLPLHVTTVGYKVIEDLVLAYRGYVQMKRYNEDGTVDTADMKDRIDVLGLGLLEGDRLHITIQGADDNALSLAYKLYSAFSSKYEYCMDIDRFYRTKKSTLTMNKRRKR